MLELKLLQTTKHKIMAGIIGTVAFIICYMIPNHFQFVESTRLYLFDFEKAIPPMASTVWFYCSDYLYIFVVLAILSDKENLSRTFYGFILLLLICMVVFFVYPTVYDRPGFFYEGLSGQLLKLVHSLDTPNNCCPSVHVGATFLCCFAFIYEKRRYLPIFIIWALIISISTLTLKQHYVLDIIWGFLLAVIVRIIVNSKLIKFRS